LNVGSECDHLPEAGNNNYLGSECDHLPEAGDNNYLGSECDHLPEAGNIYIGIHGLRQVVAFAPKVIFIA
jgi:hypothetical protein